MADEAEDIEVALDESPVQRTPCVLVLDTSGSMATNNNIGELNQALLAFQEQIESDAMLRQQVIICIVTFGSTVEVSDWVQGDNFVAPTLEASGQTSMGQAMRTAHAAIDELRSKLQTRGTPYTRPWIFLMSDGNPTDEWQDAADESRQRCEAKRAVVWPFAVKGANPAALIAFARSDMDIYLLEKRSDFQEIFSWLGSSLGAVASSSGGGQLQLAPPNLKTISVGVS